MIMKSGLHQIKRATMAAAGILLLAVPTPSMAFGMLARAFASTDAAEPAAPVQFQLKRGKLPRDARYLTGQEVFELYVGKTWRWGEGGGYFGPGAVFRARTYGDSGVSDAGGTWAVNDKGRMCFRAVWTDADGSANANTCFDHVLMGGDIYQRRAPDGQWYIFRHAVPEENDEAAKLVDGNLVRAMVRK